jgi:hypothetical protein
VAIGIGCGVSGDGGNTASGGLSSVCSVNVVHSDPIDSVTGGLPHSASPHKGVARVARGPPHHSSPIHSVHLQGVTPVVSRDAAGGSSHSASPHKGVARVARGPPHYSSPIHSSHSDPILSVYPRVVGCCPPPVPPSFVRETIARPLPRAAHCNDAPPDALHVSSSLGSQPSAAAAAAMDAMLAKLRNECKAMDVDAFIRTHGPERFDAQLPRPTRVRQGVSPDIFRRTAECNAKYNRVRQAALRAIQLTTHPDKLGPSPPAHELERARIVFEAASRHLNALHAVTS